MNIQTIGVIGAGTMGHGIAQACAVSGLSVVMVDIDDAAVQRGLGAVSASLDRLVKKLREQEKELARLEEEMERLKKKTEEAARIGDAREREEELKRLAREQGCTILLVTHDSRILDIADRTLSLEDGRLC